MTNAELLIRISARDEAAKVLNGLNSELKNLGVSAQNTSGKVGGLNLGSMVAGAGAVIAGIMAVKSSLDVLFDTVGKARQWETLTLQFKVLLGSTEAAQTRLKELADFAAATPFELPEIAEASRVLQVFTKGALATTQGLTLVGDVAAGVQRPFSEVALWVGRLWDALESGRPAGEATARLQEMGAISGEVRAKMEALAARGLSRQAWVVMQTQMESFKGTMSELSVSGSGLESTLTDSFSGIQREIGASINEGIKPTMVELINFLSDPKTIEAAKQLGIGIADSINQIKVAAIDVAAFLKPVIDIINQINSIGNIKVNFPKFWGDPFSIETTPPKQMSFIGKALEFMKSKSAEANKELAAAAPITDSLASKMKAYVAPINAATAASDKLATSVKSIGQAAIQIQEPLLNLSDIFTVGTGLFEASKVNSLAQQTLMRSLLTTKSRQDAAGMALPSFATGGIVPGPIGSPRLIIAHGGEPVGLSGGGLSINSPLVGTVIVQNEADENRLIHNMMQRLQEGFDMATGQGSRFPVALGGTG